VWASGSQVWNGNIGTLIPKPRNMPPKIHSWAVRDTPPWATASARPVKVKVSAPVRKNRARKLTSMRADPNRVNRKNFSEA